jgi:hypothetical protein
MPAKDFHEKSDYWKSKSMGYRVEGWDLTEKEQKIRLLDLIKKVDRKFLFNLIVYTRKEMYLRSITHLLVVEYAKMYKGDAKRQRKAYK